MVSGLESNTDLSEEETDVFKISSTRTGSVDLVDFSDESESSGKEW